MSPDTLRVGLMHSQTTAIPDGLTAPDIAGAVA